MKSFLLALPWYALLLFAVVTRLDAQQPPPPPVPDIDGYITRVASPTDFDVNGFKVLLSGETHISEGSLKRSELITGDPSSYLGAHVLVFGKVERSKHSVRAERLLFLMSDGREVKGFGTIDGLPSPLPRQSEGKLVRADGYLILLAPKTAITLTPPLASLSDVGANVWISYQGAQRSDGIVIASSAVLTSNRLTAGEEKVRAKSDYDPAAVNPDDKQSTASKFLLGVDIKRIPPYRDDAMQARIDKIGESLVPEYQKRLSDSDPAKVRFRFQLVDVPGWRDTAISPGGVILVPKQVVERMQNDSQLAAVLADGVAAQLEKGAFRMLSLNHKAEAAELASLAIPFAGGVGIGVTAKVYSDALRRIQDQAARVSLWLMNDAGYTITEAPKAWWLLSSKETKPLVEVKLPEHVGYLYEALATTWRDEIANAKKDPASP